MIDEIKELFHSEYEDYELNLKDRIEMANKYIKDIKEEGNWAGEIEINKMTEVLDINILCYTKGENAFHLKAVYFGTESNYYTFKNSKISKNNIMKNIPAFFNFKYVDYIYNNHNKYNEIYDYLKENKIPQRIESIINPKKRQKKIYIQRTS